MGVTLQALARCGRCGFDSAQWNDRDTIATIRRAPDIVRHWLTPLDAEQVNMRPRPDMWSPLEYVDHLRETIFSMRFVVDLAEADPGADLGPIPPPRAVGAHRVLDADECLEQLGFECESLRVSLSSLRGDEWGLGVLLSDRLHTATWASRHALHELWHHLHDIARIATIVGPPIEPQRGTIAQISRSGGGVPKDAVDSAVVDRSGLVGDTQSNRKHHGRPWQALCLWSSEVIAELVGEGHPIHPGAAGENITIAGIDWSSLHGGAVITIGDMVCQLSAPAVPCAKNDRWFSDGDSRRIGEAQRPDSVRWYATVLSPGTITTGDAVVLHAPS